MPLARFHLYAQGIDVWVAPTLAPGDGWIATMRHIARENRMFVVGVNPCLHVDQIPADFPDRDSGAGGLDDDDADWVEPGNSVIVGPDGPDPGRPGPARGDDPVRGARPRRVVRSARRFFDPVGHYNRPDVFRLPVDTRSRPAVSEITASVDVD